MPWVLTARDTSLHDKGIFHREIEQIGQFGFSPGEQFGAEGQEGALMHEPGKHEANEGSKRLLLALLGVSVLLLVAMVVFFSHIEGRVNETLKRGLALAEEHANILLYDEILTMSASMAAATGNREWIDRYNRYEPRLLTSLENALALSDTGKLKLAVKATETANNQLVELERQSFVLVDAGDAEAAHTLLNSPTYRELKQAYASGMATVADTLQEEIEQTERFVERSSWLAVVASSVGLAVLVTIWLMMWRIFASWRSSQAQLLGKARQAHLAAEEARSRIKAVVDTAVDSIVIIDRNGIIESVNPATERLFGYPAANLVGNNISMLMPAPHAENHDGYLRRYHETGEARVIGAGREVEARRVDGTVFPIELSVSRLELASGLRFAGIIHDITERRRFEQRLQNANADLRTMSLVANNTDNAVIVTDPEGRITWVNQGFTEISGYILEEVLGRRPLLDLLQGPETDMVVVARIEERLREGLRVDEEIVNYTKAGEPYWQHIEIAPVYDDQGELVQFVALGQDITEEKRLLTELQEAREAAERERDAVTEVNRIMSLTRAALDRTGVAEFWNSAIDGRVLRVSNYACEHLGYSREELLQMTVSDFDPHFTEDRFAELVVPIKEDGWQRFETLHQTRDRRRIPVEVTVMHEPGRGQREDFFVSFVTDITQRKENEYLLIQARENAEAASREEQRSRSFLSTLLEALPVAVFYKDTQGRYLGCNKHFEQTIGVTEEQVRAKTAMELWPGDLAETDHQKDLDLIHHPEPQTYEYQVETKSGERRDVLYHKQVYFDEKGEMAGVIGAFVDISELKRTERLLAQSKREAEDASRAKSTFLATMSHEIRTPLNGVVGTMDMLEHTSLLPSQLDLVRTAKDSAHLLRGVIDDVLDFSKIESGRMELESVPLSLESQLDTVAENLRHQAYKVGVDLLIFFDPNVPRVMGDPVRLKQILFNLGGNAVKFSKNLPDRSGKVLISVRLQEVVAQQAKLLIEVKDNGIGMSAEVRERLFQPFMQAEGDTTRRFGGTGLGLVITRRLIELMGGKVAVESEPDRGSNFTVRLTLPALIEEAETDTSSLEGIQILLIDDERESSHILQSYLQHAGAIVTVAAPGQARQICPELRDRTEVAVVVIDNHGDKEISSAVREQLCHEFDQVDLRFVVVERGRRRYPRVDQKDGQTLDLNAMRRRTLLHAVAAAIGRIDPEPLPAAPASDQISRLLDAEAARAAGRMILLVDDNETNRKVIGQQLVMLGCGVEYAEDGRQALSKWRSGDYAMLLTDCHMPDMDGYELSRSIREDERQTAVKDGRGHLPIIAVTADAMKGAANQCYDAGMDGYLTKPMQLNELDAVLRKWLGSPPPADSPALGGCAEAVSPERRVDGMDSDADMAAVDPNVLAELVGSNERSILTGLYQDFLASNGPTAWQIEAANRARDFNELGSLAHKLKSAARTVGANVLADTCLALEEACKEKDEQRIASQMQGFIGLFLKVQTWIDRYNGGD